MSETHNSKSKAANPWLKYFILLMMTFGAMQGFAQDCDSIPPLNQQILTFVTTKLNHKVGHGQCWDLAAAALNSVGAKWDGAYKFGRVVDPKKECVFPGDIIQFEGVKVEYKVDGGKSEEIMSHHTAVIYKVYASGIFDLIHQNTAYTGHKVGISRLELQNIKRGKYTIFRPFGS